MWVSSRQRQDSKRTTICGNEFVDAVLYCRFTVAATLQLGESVTDKLKVEVLLDWLMVSPTSSANEIFHFC